MQPYKTLENYKWFYATLYNMMQMIPYMNDKALTRSLIKQVREELRKRGYSEKAIEEIVRWYE